jgi:hypothetical protein
LLLPAIKRNFDSAVFDGEDEKRDCYDTIKRNFDSAASDGEDEERDGWKQGDMMRVMTMGKMIGSTMDLFGRNPELLQERTALTDIGQQTNNNYGGFSVLRPSFAFICLHLPSFAFICLHLPSFAFICLQSCYLSR